MGQRGVLMGHTLRFAGDLVRKQQGRDAVLLEIPDRSHQAAARMGDDAVFHPHKTGVVRAGRIRQAVGGARFQMMPDARRKRDAPALQLFECVGA